MLVDREPSDHLQKILRIDRKPPDGSLRIIRYFHVTVFLEPPAVHGSQGFQEWYPPEASWEGSANDARGRSVHSNDCAIERDRHASAYGFQWMKSWNSRLLRLVCTVSLRTSVKS